MCRIREMTKVTSVVNCSSWKSIVHCITGVTVYVAHVKWRNWILQVPARPVSLQIMLRRRGPLCPMRIPRAVKFTVFAGTDISWPLLDMYYVGLSFTINPVTRNCELKRVISPGNRTSAECLSIEVLSRVATPNIDRRIKEPWRQFLEAFNRVWCRILFLLTSCLVNKTHEGWFLRPWLVCIDRSVS